MVILRKHVIVHWVLFLFCPTVSSISTVQGGEGQRWYFIGPSRQGSPFSPQGGASIPGSLCPQTAMYVYFHQQWRNFLFVGARQILEKSLTTIQKWTTTKKKWKLIHIICVYLSPHVKHCQRQCGITWGAINEPIRSSKAIAKCIIINFLDKNVVITCFHDRHAVFYFYRTWIRSLAMLFTHWPTHCR